MQKKEILERINKLSSKERIVIFLKNGGRLVLEKSVHVSGSSGSRLLIRGISVLTGSLVSLPGISVETVCDQE